MDLRQLEHFVAVAEERSFTRAAQRASIVQSGLSASVRLLERELGAALFVRSTRRVTLTGAGLALLPEARRALAAARAGREAVQAVDGLRRGTLSIGITQVFAPRLDLPGALAAFRRDHPGVELRLWQASPDEELTALREGRLDLAFMPLPSPPGEGLEATPLVTDALVLACAAGHRLARRRRVALAELAAETFVELPASWVTRRLADRAMTSAGIAPRQAIEVNDITTCLELVASGLGVAIVPGAAGPRGTDAVLVPLARRIAWELHVVRPSGGALSSAAREMLRRVLPEHAGAG